MSNQGLPTPDNPGYHPTFRLVWQPSVSLSQCWRFQHHARLLFRQHNFRRPNRFSLGVDLVREWWKVILWRRRYTWPGVGLQCPQFPWGWPGSPLFRSDGEKQQFGTICLSQSRVKLPIISIYYKIFLYLIIRNKTDLHFQQDENQNMPGNLTVKMQVFDLDSQGLSPLNIKKL